MAAHYTLGILIDAQDFGRRLLPAAS